MGTCVTPNIPKAPTDLASILVKGRCHGADERKLREARDMKLSEEMKNNCVNQTVDFLYKLNDNLIDLDSVCTNLVKPAAKTVTNLGSKFSELEARISQCEEAILDDDDDDDDDEDDDE